MQCPVCGEEMRPGRLTYRNSFVDSHRADHGLSRKVLFLPDGTPSIEEVAVVLTDGPQRGFRCTTCLAVLVVGRGPE